MRLGRIDRFAEYQMRRSPRHRRSRCDFQLTAYGAPQEQVGARDPRVQRRGRQQHLNATAGQMAESMSTRRAIAARRPLGKKEAAARLASLRWSPWARGALLYPGGHQACQTP